jgi:hypothetical protein
MACGIVSGGRAKGVLTSNLLGWKAMPFALEDLDSNYFNLSEAMRQKVSINFKNKHTFVSMFGEEVDAILTAARYVKLTPRA